MEEADLMKERLLAITVSVPSADPHWSTSRHWSEGVTVSLQERHRIQEQIRRKRLELDQEKLKLQHLKVWISAVQMAADDVTARLSSNRLHSAVWLVFLSVDGRRDVVFVILLSHIHLDQQQRLWTAHPPDR